MHSPLKHVLNVNADLSDAWISTSGHLSGFLSMHVETLRLCSEPIVLTVVSIRFCTHRPPTRKKANAFSLDLPGRRRRCKDNQAMF